MCSTDVLSSFQFLFILLSWELCAAWLLSPAQQGDGTNSLRCYLTIIIRLKHKVRMGQYMPVVGEG